MSWFDWGLLQTHGELFGFFQKMIAFRKAHACLRRQRYFDGSKNARGLADISWHGCKLFDPGFNDPNARALGFTLAGADQQADLHVLMNMYHQPLPFEIPVLADRKWYRAIDTSEQSPQDICEPGSEQVVLGSQVQVAAHSVCVFISR